MPNQEIKISVLSKDDGDGFVFIRMQLTNGISSNAFEFWGYKDEFKKFGAELASFPQTIDSVLRYEKGEPGNGRDYFLMEVSCYEKNGHSAMYIVVHNNGPKPYTNRSEFYIRTVPASLNKLGHILNSWDLNSQEEIHWVAES
jgi:hypothetical protein